VVVKEGVMPAGRPVSVGVSQRARQTVPPSSRVACPPAKEPCRRVQIRDRCVDGAVPNSPRVHACESSSPLPIISGEFHSPPNVVKPWPASLHRVAGDRDAGGGTVRGRTDEPT
jgi:hypothetical protein